MFPAYRRNGYTYRQEVIIISLHIPDALSGALLLLLLAVVSYLTNAVNNANKRQERQAAEINDLQNNGGDMKTELKVKAMQAEGKIPLAPMVQAAIAMPPPVPSVPADPPIVPKTPGEVIR